MTAPDAFDRLCALAGDWHDTDHSVEVSYRTTAHGSALAETWRWPERGIESLTVYHLDGERLMATHYCPVGNQPRLAWRPGPDPDRLGFTLLDVTNLRDPGESHCTAFWFRIESPEAFVRSETYAEAGSAEERIATYRRAG